MSYSRAELREMEQSYLQRLLVVASWDSKKDAAALVVKTQPDDWTDYAAAAGAKVCAELMANGERPTRALVKLELLSTGGSEAWSALESASAEYYREGVMTHTEIESLAEWVREAGLRRSLVRAIRDCDQMTRSNCSLDELHSATARRFREALAGMSLAKSLHTWTQDVIEDDARECEAREADPGSASEFLDTGFEPLNEIVRGLGLGQYSVLAALPGVGKTSLGLQIAHFAAEAPHKALFFTHEMSQRRIARRIASQVLSVPEPSLDSRLLREAVKEMKGSGVYLCDQNLTYHQIPAAVDTFMLEHPELRLVVVDYLQRYARDDWAEVAEASKTLQSLGRERGIAVLALAQFTREGERVASNGGRPDCSMIHGGSQVRKDADLIMTLHNDKEAGADPSACDLVVEKNRNGGKGVVPLQFLSHYTRFRPSGPWMPPNIELEEVPL